MDIKSGWCETLFSRPCDWTNGTMRKRPKLRLSMLRGKLLFASLTSAIAIVMVVLGCGSPRFWSLQAGSEHTVFVHLESLRLTICVSRSTAARSSGLIYFILRRIEEKTEELEECIDLQQAMSGIDFTTSNPEDYAQIIPKDRRHQAVHLHFEQVMIEDALEHAFFYTSKTLSEIIRARGYCGVLVCLNPTLSEFVVLSIPGWLQLGILAIGPMALIVTIIRQRRFLLPTACGQCSYNLIGITSPVCPECGTPIPKEQKQSIA
ncbi:hypothetical protein B7486_01110 [cyanobacterium TDX16]|nr:hypothetical protein B7486_01110 [cyanobacterium TDX16]